MKKSTKKFFSVIICLAVALSLPLHVSATTITEVNHDNTEALNKIKEELKKIPVYITITQNTDNEFMKEAVDTIINEDLNGRKVDIFNESNLSITNDDFEIIELTMWEKEELETVHTNIASKIIAKMTTAVYDESSLS